MMGGFLQSPTFTPHVAPIALGATGQVLTMSGGVPVFATATGGGGNLPGVITFASPAGSSNNVNPGGGFPAGVGRLFVTLGSGNGTWTGLLAGGDGQEVLLINADPTNVLTLNSADAGSTAANRFAGPGNLILPPGARTLAVYTAGSVNRWSIG